MNKLNLNGRTMSVSNWNSDKNNKLAPRTNVSTYKPTLVDHEVNLP